MGPAAICITMALLGVEYGWRPLPEGGLEFIIQLTPQEAAQPGPQGELALSAIPPNVRGVRRLRVVVGTGPVPRFGETAVEPAAPGTEGNVAAPFIPPFDPLPRSIDYPADRVAPSIAQPPAGQPGPSLAGVQSPPGRLLPAPQGRPLGAQAAAYVDTPGGDSPSASDQSAAKTAGAAEDAKPWLPLTLALSGLLGSVAGMMYLGWIAWGYRTQYRQLLDRMIDTGRESSPAQAPHPPLAPDPPDAPDAGDEAVE